MQLWQCGMLRLARIRNKSEDVQKIGKDGYSSERACSRHSLVWQQGALRDEARGGERKDESDEEEDNDNISEHNNYKKSPPLFEVRDVGNKGNEHATDNVGNSGNKVLQIAHPEILGSGVAWCLIVEWWQGKRGRCRSRNDSIWFRLVNSMGIWSIDLSSNKFLCINSKNLLLTINFFK